MNAPLFVIFSKLIQQGSENLDKHTNLLYNKTIEYEQIIQPLQRVIGARAVNAGETLRMRKTKSNTKGK